MLVEIPIADPPRAEQEQLRERTPQGGIGGALIITLALADHDLEGWHQIISSGFGNTRDDQALEQFFGNPTLAGTGLALQH